MMKRCFYAAITAGSILMIYATLFGEESNGDKEKIQAKTEAYKNTYNKHDAKALAAFWAENAVYIDPDTGGSITGHEAIAKEFEQLFAELKDVQMETKIESIEFPNKDTAIETGLATLTIPGKPTSQSRFQATFEKRNEDWVITKVSELEIPPPAEENEHLNELKWLIGSWSENKENRKVETNAQWEMNKNFILMKFAMSVLDQPEFEGKLIIGWDPVKEQITSWVFDSDGGHGSGVWKKMGNKWVIENVYTFANGSRGSSTNIYTLNSDKNINFQSTEREIDGEFLPDIEPINISKNK